MEKIITQFSRLLWSIFHPLRRGRLQDGGGRFSFYQTDRRLKLGSLRATWLAASDDNHHLSLTRHCFCHQAWHVADPPVGTTSLLLFFLSDCARRKKKKGKKSPNGGGGVVEAKPIVSVFIGSWINMAFLIQKGPAVMESEYLPLPPGAGVQWQGRCW